MEIVEENVSDKESVPTPSDLDLMEIKPAPPQPPPEEPPQPPKPKPKAKGKARVRNPKEEIIIDPVETNTLNLELKIRIIQYFHHQSQ